MKNEFQSTAVLEYAGPCQQTDVLMLTIGIHWCCNCSNILWYYSSKMFQYGKTVRYVENIGSIETHYLLWTIS